MPNIITRRTFLERSLQVALGAAASASLSVPPFLQRALAAGALPATTRKIFFIFLRGGNDAVNTVIPWADPAYNAVNRPSLYIPPPDPLTSVTNAIPGNANLTRTLDLGNGFAGLHPALVDLRSVYNAGELAVLHRVGYPKQSRSHFDSQKYWENGIPRDSFVSSGVLYRAIVDSGLYLGHSFPGVSVQSTSPLILRGEIAMPSLSDPARYDVLGVAPNAYDRQKLLNTIDAQYHTPFPEKDNRAQLVATGQSIKTSIDVLKAVGISRNDFFDTDGTTHLFPIDAASNQRGVPGNAYGFFNNLKVAAQILANTDAIVTGTQLDGFDTHNGQGAVTGDHANLLLRLGWAIHALRQYFINVNPALWNDTVIVTLSEFGRTSKENGSLGTDHAEAGVMFVAGGHVEGGVYQCHNNSWTVGPAGSLFQVNSRYLRRSVDYRSVLGEIIRDHLGVSSQQLGTIIPGYADAREKLVSGGVSPDGTPIVGELGLIA